MTTEQQIQLKQLEKECLELQIKLEELKKNNGTCKIVKENLIWIY